MSILDRDTVNAFCRHTHVARAGAPSGPLAGLTFGLKDLFDVAGERTGAGSPDWWRTHPPAAADAPVLTRLLEAGATLVGRTHTEEMAFSLTGENAHYGTPINVRAPGRIPGGSSSGSAAAVAAGLVDFAIGTDTGGSVRAPASYCGLFGLRPTHGRVPLDGCVPLAPSFDTCGWFARDATMMARVGAVLLDPAPAPPPPASLLLARDAMALLEPRVAAALAPAIARVEAVLGPATPIDAGAEGLDRALAAFRVVQQDDIWRAHGDWIRAVRPAFGPQVGARMRGVESQDPALVPPMVEHRAQVTAHLTALLAGGRVLALPTVPDIAPLRGLPDDATTAYRERAFRMLALAGLARLPQLTLPLAELDGCPLGLSLIAAPGGDEGLLAVARTIAAP